MKYEISSEQSPDFFCPSCRRENIKDMWSFNAQDVKLSVLWCGSCGFGWVNPFPTQEALKQLYSNQPVYCLNYRSESSGGFPIRIKRISELIPQRGRLLDVGSGLGYFLNIAQCDGWEVEGVEPRFEAVKFCHENFGIKAHEGFLENFECKSSVYDVITLWDVLEHVSDHIQFLERCIDLLAPGGILVVAIPNASGWPARIFRGRWRYVMSNHLNYFKIPYINQLLSKRKLYIERADHTIKIHSFVQGLVSMLPFEVDTERIFRIGSIENEKKVEYRKKDTETTMVPSSKKNPFNKLRKLAFKFNMIPLPWGIGDMVDLYCRKSG